jgi:hypothetical protein
MHLTISPPSMTWSFEAASAYPSTRRPLLRRGTPTQLWPPWLTSRPLLRQGGASRWIPTPMLAPTSIRTRLFPLLRLWGVGFLLPPFPLGLRRSLFPPSSYGCCLFRDRLPPSGSFTMPPRIPPMGVYWPRHPPSFPTKAIRSFMTHAPTLRRIVARWVCRPRWSSTSIASRTTF